MKAAAALVAAWLAAIAVVAFLVADARDTAIERGGRAAAAMAQIMEEQTARTFQAVGVSLAAVADTWELTRPPRNDPKFQAHLAQHLAEIPYARALFIVGRDGSIIHDTDYPETPAGSLADREYFRLHRDNPRVRRSVSAPMLSRTPGAGWFVSVSERIGSGERFEGIVVAAVHPEYFQGLYARMAQGRDEALTLFHRDGLLLARFPRSGEQEVGKPFRHLPLFSYLEQGPAAGGYRVDGHMVPGRRIVAYRSVPGLPFVVHASLGEDAVLSEWRRSALGAAVAMGALTLLLAGMLVREARTRRRRALQRAQRAQAEKLEAMGQLTGGIAHDFANLLSVVSMNVEMIAGHPGDAARNAQAAAAAARTVARAKTLIARLLAFARRQPLELRSADLNALVTESHLLVAQAAGPGIELVLHLAPALPLARTDASQFEMALLNLVVNARDAMGKRGRIVLRSFADERSGAPCLDVEDDGPGMDAETRRRAMEPFFTTKEDGTGLGLPQVHGFMHQAGGSVEIEPAPQRGTRVRLVFAPAAATPTGEGRPHKGPARKSSA
jgi:signal transduction histidine kinase